MIKSVFILSTLLVFNFFNFVLADDGLLNLSTGIEVEAGITAPSVTRSFPVSFTNENNSNDISSISSTFTNADYDYLGGSFPGIGGDCSISGITSGETCQVMIEHSPTSIGDSDSFLSLSYQLNTTTLGNTHTYDVLIDGHSDNLQVAGCSNLSPVYTSQNRDNVIVNTSSIIEVEGANFSSATQVSTTQGVVSSLEVLNPGMLRFNYNSPSDPGSFDLNIQTECGSVTQVAAINNTNIPAGWIDLRSNAGVTQADPKFTTAGVNGINVNSSFGLQVDVATTSWNQYLKFDGVCGTVSNNFEIILYRSGVSSLLMPSLINEATSVEPWPGTTPAWQRQYIGIWSNGASANRTFGSQNSEGGASWNQSFANVNFEAGKYYKFVYQSAGQAGNLVEVYEVDSVFNEINQLVSYGSNKINTNATNVCAGIIPYSAGLSDYFITAVRSL